MLCKNKHRMDKIKYKKKPSTFYEETGFPEKTFYIILLRPKTVLLLKEFIVKYSPFIQHKLWPNGQNG